MAGSGEGEARSVYVVQRHFRLVRRGYDPAEVDRHLQIVSDWFRQSRAVEEGREREKRLQAREREIAEKEEQAQRALEKQRLEAEATVEGARLRANAELEAATGCSPRRARRRSGCAPLARRSGWRSSIRPGSRRPRARWSARRRGRSKR
jgi:DivIVA domain-containing protein